MSTILREFADDAAIAKSLRQASEKVRDCLWGAHDPDLMESWMDDLETLLETAAERLEQAGK